MPCFQPELGYQWNLGLSCCRRPFWVWRSAVTEICVNICDLCSFSGSLEPCMHDRIRGPYCANPALCWPWNSWYCSTRADLDPHKRSAPPTILRRDGPTLYHEGTGGKLFWLYLYRREGYVPCLWVTTQMAWIDQLASGWPTPTSTPSRTCYSSWRN